MIRTTLAVAGLAGLGLCQSDEAPSPSRGLAEPVRIEAAGAPIDVTVGHAAPFLRDMDGDGLRDLLVGEFGDQPFDDGRLPRSTKAKWGLGRFAQGKIRVYRNVGSKTHPAFQDFDYLRAKDQHASVPTT